VSTTTDAQAGIDLRKSLPIIFLARTAINTAHRIIYPFLPSLARGLGISLQAASGLVTMRVVAGLAAPFLGVMGDRYGRRRTMESALLLLVLASLMLAGIGTLPAATIAFALYGLAKVLYDPSVHAYLGDTVPYRERGRAIGLVELSWSAAWLIGVPASGFLIEQWGWRAPWIALIPVALAGLWLTHTRLPPAHARSTGEQSPPLIASTLATWHSLLRDRSVVVLLLTSFFLTLANEIPFIVYGAWLEGSFGLGLATLGLASMVVGLAEASAELGTTVLTDRWGKRRSVVVGLLGLAASLLLLPWLSGLGLAAALVGVVLMILTFEFAIVSLLPLATELAPNSRASLLSLNVTAFSLGRILGALIGGWLWTTQAPSITLHAAVGAICALVGAFLVGRMMGRFGE